MASAPALPWQHARGSLDLLPLLALPGCQHVLEVHLGSAQFGRVGFFSRVVRPLAHA